MYKILAMVIRKGFNEYSDEVVTENQGGFKVDRVKIDDTMDRNMMYQTVNNLGILEKLYRLIKMILKGLAGKVEVEKGVPSGECNTLQ